MTRHLSLTGVLLAAAVSAAAASAQPAPTPEQAAIRAVLASIPDSLVVRVSAHFLALEWEPSTSQVGPRYLYRSLRNVETSPATAEVRRLLEGTTARVDSREQVIRCAERDGPCEVEPGTVLLTLSRAYLVGDAAYLFALEQWSLTGDRPEAGLRGRIFTLQRRCGGWEVVDSWTSLLS